MRISLSWLKTFVDIKESPEELAELLTKAGLEVGAIEYPAREISGVVVAEVLTEAPHPDSDHLHLLTVDCGEQEPVPVVCGAANVAQGQKVIFAKVGATLPGNFKIKKAKLRGEVSCGMVCSMAELGIAEELLHADDKDGIRILPQDAPIGADAMAYLGLDDAILDIELTPNRADCLSVYGVAREVSALTKRTLKNLTLSVPADAAPVEEKIKVEVENGDLCPRYTATYVGGVKVKRSPIWMEARLQGAGIRPISNLVDITNYVMLEIGQPLHAFDYARLKSDKIVVRTAKEGETLTTLDGVERKLKDTDLLITNGEKSVSLAGIMGGENSEIVQDTREVLIEAAYFAPKGIHKTSKRLGLVSESSLRNEKVVDITLVAYAGLRAAVLMHQLAGGVVGQGQIDVYQPLEKQPSIYLPYQKVVDILGVEIEKSFIKEALERLELVVLAYDDKGLEVEVPSWRNDIHIAEDLVEEVARLYGYDNIPTVLPEAAGQQGGLDAGQRLVENIRDMLVAEGLHEAISYSFHALQTALLFGADEEKIIRVANPLSEAQEVMRESILAGLLDALKHNQTRQVESLGLFEIGRIFSGQDLSAQSLAKEEEHLAVLLAGKTKASFLEPSRSYDFYDAKGIVERMFKSLGIHTLHFVPYKDDKAGIWHPGRSAEIFVEDTSLGIIGELHPHLLDAFHVRGKAIAFEIALAPILEKAQVIARYKPLSRYPRTSRDLALVVPHNVLAGAVEEAIYQAGSNYLEDVHLFDVYTLDENRRSLAYGLSFVSHEETLRDEIIDKEIETILKQLENIGVTLRR